MNTSEASLSADDDGYNYFWCHCSLQDILVGWYRNPWQHLIFYMCLKHTYVHTRTHTHTHTYGHSTLHQFPMEKMMVLTGMLQLCPAQLLLLHCKRVCVCVCVCVTQMWECMCECVWVCINERETEKVSVYACMCIWDKSAASQSQTDKPWWEIYTINPIGWI